MEYLSTSRKDANHIPGSVARSHLVMDTVERRHRTEKANCIQKEKVTRCVGQELNQISHNFFLNFRSVHID